MRSLEIRTQRILNNVIIQNQKLASDFVLTQSKIMSSAQSPASKVYHPTSSVESPESRVQRPESSVQSPASNTGVQSPGIPVCRSMETIGSDVANFRKSTLEFFRSVTL